MSKHSIHAFSSQFKGGVRANLFECKITPPLQPGNNVASLIQFHCKATSIPASTIGNIDVPYKGRQLKVPGDRTFADWTVTLFNDSNMHIRSIFESWMAMIQPHEANEQKTPSHVYGKGQVTQLSRSGEAIRTYSLTSMYPTEVAAIDLAWDSNDAVEEYAVTFAVNHWSAGNEGKTSNSSTDPKWGIEVSGGSGGVDGSIWATIGR